MVAALDFVVPDLFGHNGGIARIARAMTLAFSQWADRHNIALHVHALMDEGGRHKLEYLPRPPASSAAWRAGNSKSASSAAWRAGSDSNYHAYGGQRVALTQTLVRRMWSSTAPRIVVFAHPNLAVTSLAFPPWVRCAVVAHGVDVWTPLRFERRLALRRVDALWPVSEDTARHLREVQGVAADRIRVIPNALDPFWPLPASHERGDQHVLAVSRLHHDHAYKGIDVTLAALAELPVAERPRYVVAGDGPDRERLEKMAAALGIDALFTGKVSDEVLAGLYRDAAAFVLPSTGEGFGLVYLEAMAFGLPCVAAKAGGATEVVADEVTGITIAPRDVAGLAAAITRVVGAEGAAFGRAGRARVEREFLFPTYEARVHAALDQLVLSRGRA